MTAYDYRLSLVHSRLDQELRRELGLSIPDVWRVQRLKKLKLAIKDRMQLLRSERWSSAT